MANSSIEATLRHFIQEPELRPTIDSFFGQLQEMASQDPSLNLVEINTKYTVFRYGLNDLVNDVGLILQYKNVSTELAEIITDHIPSGQLDFLKNYLLLQLRRESTWAIRLSQQLLDQKMNFHRNSEKIINFWRNRNDHNLFDSEVLKLAGLTKRREILDHLLKLRKMGIVQIRDDAQNYANVDSLIREIEAIISMDAGSVDEESVVQYKLAVSRLPNVWSIRENLSQELQSIQASYALIRDYEQCDAKKIIEALQTLADINFMFETNNGPRWASEIITQIKTCLEAKGIDQIIETSHSITSLYGLDQRVYRYCTEKLLASQPQESGVDRLLRSLRLWRGNRLADLAEIIKHNSPNKVFKGTTQPL